MTSLSRRRFLRGAAVAPFAAHAWLGHAAAPSQPETLFVGTQTTGTSKGIYAYRWDSKTGKLTELGLAAETPQPTFLALDPGGKLLFAANEVEHYKGEPTGAVSSFVVDKQAGKLQLVNTVSSKGTGTCHVSVDRAGHVVAAANYSGGSAATYLVDAHGKLSEAVSEFHYTGHGPNAERQEKPHAHRVTFSPDNRFLLINDLGLDCIHIYRVDTATGKLTPHNPPEWKSAPGSGPRALRFHPNGRWAYVVCEMTCTVVLLHWNAEAGTFETVQTTNLLTDDPASEKPTPTGAEIVIDRTGRFAYVANRGNDFIATLAIDRAIGELKLLDRVPSGGKVPRHIALDPSEGWLLAANQAGDTIAVFRRDRATGRLSPTPETYPLSHPQCLVFA